MTSRSSQRSAEGLAPWVLLGAGVVMSGVLLWVGRWLLFWADEWDFIAARQEVTLRALLAPHVDHFVAIPVLVYQGLVAVFGLRTYLPYLVVDWAAHFICVALLYRIVARRSGRRVGLAAGLSLLFLGSAFEVLLQPFQIGYLFAAIGGLVALDRLDRSVVRGWDLLIAMVALIIGVASSSLGVIFVGLLIVWGLVRHERTPIVAVMPALAAYAVWYVTWGSAGQHVPVLSVVDSVWAVLYGLGAAVMGISGLPPARFAPLGVAIALSIALALLFAVRRGWRPDPLAVAAAAALVAEYTLQTLFRGSFGVEHGARSGYLYPAAIFLWLVISGVIGHRLDTGGWRTRLPHGVIPAAATVVIIAMVLGNMRQFAGAATAARALRATELAELRLIEELRGMPNLALDVEPDPDHAPNVTAGRYLAALDRLGRPNLDWDWTADVDQAAVSAARDRLLAE